MDEKERVSLWKKYEKTKDTKLREQLIIEYAGLVKVVAGRMGMYLGYTVEYDDLVGYGVFGLIDAIDKFELTKGVKFETYASLRIRGSILDQIRKMDWIPRTLRQKQKRIDQAMMALETSLGRQPSDDELANELGISSEELDTWQNQTKLTSMVSLDEFMEQGSEVRVDPAMNPKFDGPEEVVERKELKIILEQAMETLTDNERKVVLLYYFEELTLKEISKVMEVSESRVSQLHTKSLRKLKQKLGNYMDVFNI